MGRIRIGISGWQYDSWRGDFYPRDLPRARELAYAAERLDTVEVNRTFYSLATPRAFRQWHEVTPAGFRLAVKGSRFITHSKKLAGVDTALANFWASGVLALGPKLGPVLWQLPATLRFDPARVDSFLALLPRDTDIASRVARRHDHRVRDPHIDTGARHRIRHVLEPRHPSFLAPEAMSILRRRGVALAFSHAADWPYAEEVTAGFVYVRLHGPAKLYSSAYGQADLRRWAERIRVWRDGGQPKDAELITGRRPPPRRSRDVYVYFDNDAGGYAPHQALALKDLVG